MRKSKKILCKTEKKVLTFCKLAGTPVLIILSIEALSALAGAYLSETYDEIRFFPEVIMENAFCFFYVNYFYKHKLGKPWILPLGCAMTAIPHIPAFGSTDMFFNADQLKIAFVTIPMVFFSILFAGLMLWDIRKDKNDQAPPTAL